MADPGFPRGGGANPSGVLTYDFAKVSQNLHEIERIWIREAGGASKILLCRSATDIAAADAGFRWGVGANPEEHWGFRGLQGLTQFTRPRFHYQWWIQDFPEGEGRTTPEKLTKTYYLARFLLKTS